MSPAPKPPEDVDLLARFVQEHSEQAFAQIVRRYAPVVYSAAMRQTCDAQLAQEVTQRVFISLWRKAATLCERKSLTGWLLTATRYAASDALKLQRRRLYHERKAALMRDERISAQAIADEAAPCFDAAIARLTRRTRDALLLRFYEGMSVREVAERLEISEDAAKQRIFRGIEQLRALFARKGHPIEAAALTQLLLSHTTATLPAGLVDATVRAAVAGTSKGVVLTMAISKGKCVIATAAALAFFSGSAAVAWYAVRPSAPKSIVISRSPSETGAWQEKFNRIYGLADGENLKFVPAPFIPERQAFWYAQPHGAGAAQPQPLGNGESLTLETDGQSFRCRSDSFDNTLAAALRNAAGITPGSLDRSVPASMPLPGDWVVRKGATTVEIAQGISRVLSSRLGRSVHLERRHVHRPVIVAQGDYHFVPLPGKPSNGIVELLGEIPRGAYPSQIRQTTLGELLTGISNVTGLQLVDETRQSNVKITIADHPSFGDPLIVLRNLAAQTSLKFDQKIRDVELWVLVESDGQPKSARLN